MKPAKMSLCIIMVLLLMTLTVPFASAQHIDDLFLSVEFPSTYEVITRDMIENGYESEWQTNEEMLTQWQDSGIYANAIAPIGLSEIVVTMADSSLSDFTAMSTTELEQIAQLLLPAFEEQGVTVSKWDTFETEAAAFIRLWYPNTLLDGAYTLQYHTVHSGHAYNFSNHCYHGEVSEVQEETLQSVVESIRFDDASVTTQQSLSITLPSNLPHVADSGAIFNVPEGWTIQEFYEEHDVLDVRLEPVSENGHSILFGCYDVWDELSDEDKEVSSRYYCDNGIFTMQDIAQMLGVQSYQVDTVSYDGNMYFRAQTPVSQEILGQTIDTEITYLIRVYDGWLYMFHFCGIEGSDSYGEDYRAFEDLVSDITYPPSFPPVPTVATSTTTTTRTTTTAAGSDDTVGALTPLLLIGVAVVALIVLIFGIKAALASPKRHNQNTERSVVRYCRYCGAELPEDSQFCTMCGRKIGE